MWKSHVVYECRPRTIIVTLGNKFYRILEVPPPAIISLVTAKQCSKIISKTRKFFFLMIRHHGKKKNVAMTSIWDSSTRQKKMDKVMEECGDIFTSPTGVPLHC